MINIKISSKKSKKMLLLVMELLSTKLNLHHLLSFISHNVCFTPQLKRCFNVSLHELILSCSILEEIDPFRVFPFLSLSCWLEFSGQHIETKMVIESTFLWSATWIVKIMLACVPLSSYLTSWISGWDSCLVGVSCHIPRSIVCPSLAPHVCIMFKFQLNLKWGWQNPQPPWKQLEFTKIIFNEPEMPF